MSANLNQLFQPHSWVSDDAQSADTPFIEVTHNIASGMSTLLELLFTSELEDRARAKGSNCTPILAAQDRESLMLFAIASAKLLHKHAETEIEFLNETPTPAVPKVTKVAV